MGTIMLNEHQAKRHIELLETIGQMLIKEAETLRAETKMGKVMIPKGDTKSDKKIESEIKDRRFWQHRYEGMIRKFVKPEEQQRLRQLAWTNHGVII